MAKAPDPDKEENLTIPSIYDEEETEDDDLWFMPANDEDASQSHMPWPVAAREDSLAAEAWQQAEATGYRQLVDAVQAVTRYGERLRHASGGVNERIALMTVSAVLRAEGVWLGPDQIALYRAFRLGSDDRARDLSRADWAVRRLIGGAAPQDGLREFLGLVSVSDPLPGEDHPVGDELDLLGDDWVRTILRNSNDLTKAAHGFAQWRSLGITSYELLLEPTIAALRLGAGPHAPFLPMAEGQRFDRHSLESGASGAGARLETFFAAVEAGALRAAMELDSLSAWQNRAEKATSDLSGRTPPLLISALVRYPVVSAELVSEAAECSKPAARRNLATFAERGLIRELTGQERYRFWAAQL